MKTTFLLPCLCGRELPVCTTQAGESVRCSCGAELEVPTLQGLRRLKTATVAQPAEPPPAASGWGLRQRLFLVGFVLLLAGSIMTLLFWSTRPLNIATDDLTPLQTLFLWHNLSSGPGQSLPPVDMIYRTHHAAFLRWLSVSLGVTLVGIVLVLASRRVPKKGAPPG